MILDFGTGSQLGKAVAEKMSRMSAYGNRPGTPPYGRGDSVSHNFTTSKLEALIVLIISNFDCLIYGQPQLRLLRRVNLEVY